MLLLLLLLFDRTGRTVIDLVGGGLLLFRGTSIALMLRLGGQVRGLAVGARLVEIHIGGGGIVGFRLNLRRRCMRIGRRAIVSSLAVGNVLRLTTQAREKEGDNVRY